MSGVSNENPVENVSVSSTTRAPPAAAASTFGANAAKFACPVVPHDVVLHCGDAQHAHGRTPVRQRGGSLVDHRQRLQNANRTMCRPYSGRA